MEIYQAPIVTAIQGFYGPLLSAFNKYPKLKDHLTAIAARHWEGVQSKEDCVFVEMNNYHSAYLGQSIETLQSLNLTETDSRMTIAQEYGFQSWVAIPDVKYDEIFQQALFALLFGSYQELKHFLDKYPTLVTQRSQHGHHATLLHYVASNGIPLWQQQVPHNLPDMAQLLLEKGADKYATMNVYGAKHMIAHLIASSAHPKAAGIMDELMAVING